MLHTDWSTSAFDLEAVAPRTGPFARRPFLETWWRHRAADDDRLLIADTGDGLATLVLSAATLQFAGEPDLTDYHSPLGPGAVSALVEAMTASGAETFRFDSLPEEAADVVAKSLTEVGADADRIHDDVAAVLPLPAAFEDWLSGLSRKDRHELRRKLRRFATLLGEPELVRGTAGDGFDAFVAMHRGAGGDKGMFLSDDMAEFFAALVAHAGFVVDLLVASGTPVAAAVGFEDGDGYYLYNSAYATSRAAVAPGVVMLAELIRAQIGRGARVFDFMKGDEDYKFRLGAEPRPLFTYRGALG